MAGQNGLKMLDRQSKNERISATLKETKARHALMIPVSAELKLDLKCLKSTTFRTSLKAWT